MSHSKARKIALNRGDRAVSSDFVFWLGQEEDPEGEGGEFLRHLLGGAVGELREPLGDERQKAPGKKLGDNVDLPRGHGGVQVPQVRFQGAGELVVDAVRGRPSGPGGGGYIPAGCAGSISECGSHCAERRGRTGRRRSG